MIQGEAGCIKTVKTVDVLSAFWELTHLKDKSVV